MKVKNDLIRLKIGDKHYDFNNLILDEYLKRFVLSQLTFNSLNTYKSMKQLKYCMLKFDTPIENLSNSSKLKNQDFDVCFVGGCTYNQNISENKITIEYNYNTNNIYDYLKDTTSDNYISDYYGKKITAIGFNVGWAPYMEDVSNSKNFVCAVLDTSNYNIYLQENQELSITRRDVIETDTIFYSSNKNKVPGPAHLMPYGVPQIIYQPNIYNDERDGWYTFDDPGYGILYSVGLSSYTDYIDKELIIGQDIQVEQNGTELNIKGIENYLSTDSSLFCDKNLYPGSYIYPIKTNYKYLILKYKVWQEVHSGTHDNLISTPTDTGYYYYQAIPIEKIGKTNLKIKYERG